MTFCHQIIVCLGYTRLHRTYWSILQLLLKWATVRHSPLYYGSSQQASWQSVCRPSPQLLYDSFVCRSTVSTITRIQLSSRYLIDQTTSNLIMYIISEWTSPIKTNHVIISLTFISYQIERALRYDNVFTLTMIEYEWLQRMISILNRTALSIECLFVNCCCGRKWRCLTPNDTLFVSLMGDIENLGDWAVPRWASTKGNV